MCIVPSAKLRQAAVERCRHITTLARQAKYGRFEAKRDFLMASEEPMVFKRVPEATDSNYEAVFYNPWL